MATKAGNNVKNDRYKKDYEQHIDDILSYITLCDPDKQSSIDPRTSFNPSLLKRIEPFTDEMCQKNIDPGRGFFNDVLAGDLGAPLNISLLKTYSGEEDSNKYKYHAIQIRKVVDVRELRGQVTKLHPNIYNFRSGFFAHDGSATLYNFYLVLDEKSRDPFDRNYLFCMRPGYNSCCLPGGNAVTKPFTSLRANPDYELYNNAFISAFGTQFTRRYEWGVEIGRSFGPSVNIAVPPRAILDLFRFRDIADGKKRRTALTHWVCDHWRKIPERDESAYVRKHLRGEYEFSYGEMFMKIHVSDYDRDLNRILTEQRKTAA